MTGPRIPTSTKYDAGETKTDPGWRPLTEPISLRTEKHIFNNIIADLKRGNIEYEVRPVGTRFQIWRRNMLVAKATSRWRDHDARKKEVTND